MPEQLLSWDYQWSQVVGQAWADDAFKQRLVADPATTLREYGVLPPAGRPIRVVEDGQATPNKDDVLLLVLPPKPAAADLSEEELVGGVAGPGVARCGCEACYSHTCHHCERCACGRCD